MAIIAQKLLDRVQAAPDGQWENMEIEDAVKSIISLARTKTYKKRTDNVIQTKEESGMQAVMDKMFEALGRDHPDLYRKVYDIATAQLRENDESQRI